MVHNAAADRQDRGRAEAARSAASPVSPSKAPRATASSNSSPTPIAAPTASPPASCGRSCCRTSRRGWCASRSTRPTANSSSSSRSCCSSPMAALLTGLPNTALSTQRRASPTTMKCRSTCSARSSPLDPLRRGLRRHRRRRGRHTSGCPMSIGPLSTTSTQRPAAASASFPSARTRRRAPVPAPGAPGEFGIEALPAVIAQRRQNRGMEAHRATGRQDLRLRAEPDPQSRHAGQRRAQRDAQRARGRVRSRRRSRRGSSSTSMDNPAAAERHRHAAPTRSAT